MFIKNLSATLTAFTLLTMCVAGLAQGPNVPTRAGGYQVVMQDGDPNGALALPNPHATQLQAQPSLLTNPNTAAQNYFSPAPNGPTGSYSQQNGCHNTGCGGRGCQNNGCHQEGQGHYQEGCFGRGHGACHSACQTCRHNGLFMGRLNRDDRNPGGWNRNAGWNQNGWNPSGRGFAGLFGDDNDRYFKTFGGWNDLQDYQGTVAPPGGQNVQRLGTFEDGWVVGGAIGRKISPNRRREIEFAFRDNSGDQLTQTFSNGAVNYQPLDGRIQAYSMMFNLIHSFERFRFGRWTPYVGGGIGLVTLDGNFYINNMNLSLNESAFGYQGFAGVERQMGQNLYCFIEYRCFAATETSFKYANGMVAGNLDYEAGNVLFGLQIGR